MAKDDILLRLLVGWSHREKAEAEIIAAVDAGAAAGLSWDELAEPLHGIMTGRELWDWLHPIAEGPEPPAEWLSAADG